MRHKKAAALSSLVLLMGVLAACTDQSSNSAAPAAETEGTLFDLLPESIQERGTLIFAGESRPPFRIIAEDGSQSGVDIDLQEALAKELGVTRELEIVQGLPAGLLGMQSGRYDAFNGPADANAEREVDYDVIVWVNSRTTYLMSMDRSSDYPDSDALCGARVAGIEGGTGIDRVNLLSDWCEERGEERLEFIGLADANATILAVNSDRADVAGLTETQAIDIMKENEGQYTYVTQTEEQGIDENEQGMVLAKTALTDVMFQAFERIFENGEYDRIIEKWGLERVAVEKPVLNPFTGGQE